MLVLVGLSAMWMGVASGLLVLYSADHAERAETVRRGHKKSVDSLSGTWAVLPRKT